MRFAVVLLLFALLYPATFSEQQPHQRANVSNRIAKVDGSKVTKNEENPAPEASGMKRAVAEIGQHSNMLPRNRHITLPLIERDGDRILVRRLIYFVRAIPGKGSFMTPPGYVATYNWNEKKFVSLIQLENDPEKIQEQPFEAPVFASPDEIIPEFEKIWRLYDVLIPRFAGSKPDIDGQTVAAAKLYLTYLARHQEKPLAGHYDKYSGSFIEFVKTCAGKK